MTEGTFFRRLHGSAIRVQVPLVLAAVPVASGVWGVALVPLVVDAAASGQGSVRAAATDAAWLAVLILVSCVATTTAGAALLLRGSMRSVIERLQDATGAIAGGDFAHRIDSARSDELGQLAASIDTMAERLERLEQARRRLLASVSHELRTPLTIIRGHAYTLARREADAIRRDRLELVQEEAARLAELVEDLMDAATLQAGSVRLCIERCDLGSLADLAITRFREEAALRGVRIERRGVRRAALVDADPARIAQVLANLLANAVRHASAGSTIEVAVEARRRQGERLLTVANAGPAVPATVIDHIFEPFVQGGERPGRVGLGMAIAHGLARAHGGDLVLASTGEHDGIVRFRMALPAPARSAPARPQAAADRPSRAQLQAAGS